MTDHPPPLRVGSVCTGYGGLDEAVRQVFGGELAWVSDVDPGACRIIAHRMPGVHNLGDLRFVHWLRTLLTLGPVDILCGGYPCQPFSLAGELKGIDDARHLWPFIACALRVLRPRVAIFENVANHLRVGFDTVLRDLADLGFDVEWCVVRADEVGAPHQRRRLFILATASDAPRPGRQGPDHQRGRATGDGGVAADAPHLGHERSGPTRGRRVGPADHGVLAAAPASVGRGEGRPEPARQQGRPRVAFGRGAAAADAGGNRFDGHGELSAGRNSVRAGVRADVDGRCPRAVADTRGSGRGPQQHGVPEGEPNASWGRFTPAIARWEAATGRRAPWATDDQRRLSPAFVEWMMGLPDGHVTAVPGLTRTQKLKALGNGVVPQQAAAAIRLLAERAGVWA